MLFGQMIISGLSYCDAGRWLENWKVMVPGRKLECGVAPEGDSEKATGIDEDKLLDAKTWPMMNSFILNCS